mmetsp:Transcript_4160/g.14683  ORF Transcript_4160/g.14683 Transcript_4160/m.14683 type:complete len:253 (+) Transcript_4160:2372-3130(+)
MSAEDGDHHRRVGWHLVAAQVGRLLCHAEDSRDGRLQTQGLLQRVEDVVHVVHVLHRRHVLPVSIADLLHLQEDGVQAVVIAQREVVQEVARPAQHARGCAVPSREDGREVGADELVAHEDVGARLALGDGRFQHDIEEVILLGVLHSVLMQGPPLLNDVHECHVKLLDGLSEVVPAERHELAALEHPVNGLLCDETEVLAELLPLAGSRVEVLADSHLANRAQDALLPELLHVHRSADAGLLQLNDAGVHR